MNSLNRLLGPFREFGFLGGLLYGIDRFFILNGSRFRVFFYELVAQPVADAAMLPKRRGRSIEVRELPRDHPAYDTMPLTPDVLAHRFRQDTVCLGAFQKDVLIAYMWFCFKSYDEDEVQCTYVPSPVERSVWDYDFYVWPKHRTGLAFITLWDGANAYLRDRGVRTTFSRVSRFNTVSRNSHKHFGAVCVGRAVFLRAKRFQLMLATCAPYVHLTTSGTTRPSITLAAPQVEADSALATTP